MPATTKKRTRKTKATKEFNVFLARLGEQSVVYRMPTGSTVSDLLTQANYNGDVNDVRADARPVDRKDRLKENQVITIVPKVQGGL